MLWDTDVTWGDKLEWEQDGEVQVAMMVLFTTNGTDFSGVLWGIEGSSVGNPIPFENLTNADNRNGHSTVHETSRYSEIEGATDLPLSFGVPNGAYDGNIPYMQPYDVKDWPQGSAALVVTSVGSPALKVPAWFGKVSGAVDIVLTAIGSREKSPYWYNHLFGNTYTYPTICMSGVLSRNCNYDSGSGSAP